MSGNVRAKLAAAESATLVDEQFRANVDALRQVQPTDLMPSEIDARLGSTWMPTEEIERFAEETLGESGISVSHAPQLGLWVVRRGTSARFSVANTTEWGTDRRGALELIEDALSLRGPTGGHSGQPRMHANRSIGGGVEPAPALLNSRLLAFTRGSWLEHLLRPAMTTIR